GIVGRLGCKCVAYFFAKAAELPPVTRAPPTIRRYAKELRMRVKSFCASLLVVMSAAALPASMAGAGKDELARVLNGFYTVHQQSSQDGVPDTKQRAKYQPFVSPELNKLLADADAAEARYTKANPDSPPMMEGDLFSPNFEGISSFKVGTCATK